MVNNKIRSAFSLGYFLSLVRERISDPKFLVNSQREKFLILFHEEIISTISFLYQEVFDMDIKDNISLYNNAEVFLNQVQNYIEEKNHWGDDSFLEFSFLFGCFISVAEASKFNSAEKIKFEEILCEILDRIDNGSNINVCNQTLSYIFSNQNEDGGAFRRELFNLICNSHSKHDCICYMQQFLDNPSFFHSFAYA